MILVLEGKFCDSQDLMNAMENYKLSTPETWKHFFSSLLLSYNKSRSIKRKCDTIFQIAYSLIHDAQKKTPLQVSTAQAIHETTRFEKLLQIFNRLGVGASYDQVERQDQCLVSRTIARAQGHHVPLPPAMKKLAFIHGAMDNFDHEEQTAPGIGGSHDTVLVLFQHNFEPISQTEQDSLENYEINVRSKVLENVLPCQHCYALQQTKTAR